MKAHADTLSNRSSAWSVNCHKTAAKFGTALPGQAADGGRAFGVRPGGRCTAMNRNRRVMPGGPRLGAPGTTPAAWKGALLEARASAHVKNPEFAPRPGTDAEWRGPAATAGSPQGSPQDGRPSQCGFAGQAGGSFLAAPALPEAPRYGEAASSEVSAAAARMQSRNLADMAIVVWYVPPACLRTSARTKPRSRQVLSLAPLQPRLITGVRTSADVLNVAMLHQPGYRS